MGDIESEDHPESLDSAWASLLGFADRYRDLGYGPLADQLRAGGPPPPSTRNTPLIVDTDIGGDPDDAIAVTCAARNTPELALVITADEHRGARARFARHLLDLNDRSDVPVVAGADLGNTRYHAIDGLTPADIPDQPDNVVDAVRAVCGATAGPVRWVGQGPLTNLARVLVEAPDLGARLAITQMGGSINTPTDRVEHNFRLDPNAAQRVVASANRLLLVISDTTFTPEIAVGPDADLYHDLAADTAPPWAALLRRHLDQWFTDHHPASMQHDPLTLAAALGLPFIDASRRGILVDHDAHMTVTAPDRAAARITSITTGADYPAFRRWLATQLRY